MQVLVLKRFVGGSSLETLVGLSVRWFELGDERCLVEYVVGEGVGWEGRMEELSLMWNVEAAKLPSAEECWCDVVEVVVREVEKIKSKSGESGDVVVWARMVEILRGMVEEMRTCDAGLSAREREWMKGMDTLIHSREVQSRS